MLAALMAPAGCAPASTRNLDIRFDIEVAQAALRSAKDFLPLLVSLHSDPEANHVDDWTEVFSSWFGRFRDLARHEIANKHGRQYFSGNLDAIYRWLARALCRLLGDPDADRAFLAASILCAMGDAGLIPMDAMMSQARGIVAETLLASLDSEAAVEAARLITGSTIEKARMEEVDHLLALRGEARARSDEPIGALDDWRQILSRRTSEREMLRVGLPSEYIDQDIQAIRSNIAAILLISGDVNGAIAELRDLLEAQVSLLGRHHPLVLSGRQRLAEYQQKNHLLTEAVTTLSELILDVSENDTANIWTAIRARELLADVRGEAGQLNEAISDLDDLIPLTTSVAGAQSLSVLTMRRDRAWWQLQNGKLTSALAEFSKVATWLGLLEGENHPSTLIVRRMRAECYIRCGYWVAAEDDLVAVNVVHYALGAERREAFIARLILANCRRERGDPAGSVAFLDQLVDDQTRVLGADSPDTLLSRHELAYSRCCAGDLQVAIAEFETLVDDRGRVLGPDHPGTLASRQVLAARCRGSEQIRDWERAIRDLKDLLADKMRVLGADHPDTLWCRYHLARCRRENGDLAGAAADLVRLTEDFIRVQGHDHLDTLLSRHELAYSRCCAGDLQVAIAEFETLVDDCGRVLGPDHPETLASRQVLAARCRGSEQIRDWERAIRDLKDLLADKMRVLGADHPDTLWCRYHLARCRGENGDLSGAVAALAKLTDDWLNSSGPNDPSSFFVRRQLAVWRWHAGDLPGAISDYEELVLDQDRVLGADHPDTLQCRSHLASCRRALSVLGASEQAGL
jgi:tetratricopeptide (TPR) repeat protein